MKIITEIELREKYKAKPFNVYQLDQGVRLTPAAYEYLAGLKVEIHDAKGALEERSQHNRSASEPAATGGKGFILVETGEMCAEKPEEYTHLKGNQLVRKNHPRIKFRGKLDSMESRLNAILSDLGDEMPTDLRKELTLIFQYLGKIIRAEVMEEPLPFLEINNWTADDVRDRSHHPKKYYGVNHFQAMPEHGKLMSGLNLLRSQARELEIAAVDAFCDGKTGKMERQDIAVALNRMSSLLYIMMCRLLAGDY